MKFPIKRIIKDAPKYGRTAKRKDLEALLDYLDHAYYVEDNPPVTNAIYDALYDAYAERWPKSPRLKATGKSNKQEDVQLPVPMASLDKVKPDTKKLTRFLEGFSGHYVLGDKLDGIAVSIVYEDGKPIAAYKRGSGVLGRDITHHIPNMRIPKKLPIKSRFIVRTEGIIDRLKFEKLFAGEYSNARNFAGGVLNTLVPTPYVKKLDFIAFEILEGKHSDKSLDTQLVKLSNLNFDVVFYGWERANRVTQKFLTRMYEARMSLSSYELDGIVVTKCIKYERGAAKPKHAKAYKMNALADMVDVELTDVVWEETRTNYFAPVVTYDSIRLGGVNNDTATAHNAFFVQHGYTKDQASAAKKAGKKLKKRPLGPGAIVRVVRSGKVIPTIHEVLKGVKEPKMPDTPWEMRGVHAYSTEDTELSKLKAIEHFFKCVGVDGLKLSTVKKLYAAGYTDINAIRGMTLKEYSDIDGLGRSKGMVHVKQMKEKAYKATFVQLANASNLFIGFSAGRLEKIVEVIPKPTAYYKEHGKEGLRDAVANIEGFKELANDFAKAMPKFRKFLKAHGLKLKKPKKIKIESNSMEGMVITFTGVRDAAVKDYVTKNGGLIKDMRKDTNLLIIPNEDYTSSKVDKAEASEPPIPVLTLAEFKSKYNI